MTLCKHVETKFVPAGALLFRPGQVDDSIYVVKSGRLSVFIVEQVRSFALCKYTRTCVVCLCMLQARHGYGKHHYLQCHITICFASTEWQCQYVCFFRTSCTWLLQSIPLQKPNLASAVVLIVPTNGRRIVLQS